MAVVGVDGPGRLGYSFCLEAFRVISLLNDCYAPLPCVGPILPVGLVPNFFIHRHRSINASLPQPSFWDKFKPKNKDADMRDRQAAQMALARQRLLTLVFGDMETIRMVSVLPPPPPPISHPFNSAPCQLRSKPRSYSVPSLPNPPRRNSKPWHEIGQSLRPMHPSPSAYPSSLPPSRPL